MNDSDYGLETIPKVWNTSSPLKNLGTAIKAPGNGAISKVLFTSGLYWINRPMPITINLSISSQRHVEDHQYCEGSPYPSKKLFN
jgi:hypothetical protein